MLYRFIKSNWFFGYVLLPVLAAAIWFTQLASPMVFDFYEGENEMILFHPLYELLKENQFVLVLAGLLLLIFAAVLIQRINVEYGFFRIRSLLPGILFILISSGFNELRILHPVHVASIFYLLATYRLFNAFDLRKPFSQVFDACFLLSIGSLFYVNLIVLLPAFIAGALILGRETRWREILISIMGFAIPWVFVFSIYFLFDNTPSLINLLKSNFVNQNDRLAENIPELVFLGFMLLLTLIGSYLIIVQYDEKKVSIRQYFLVFFLMFVSLILSFFLVPAVSTEVFTVAAIPVTFLLSNLLLSINRNIWGEIIIYLLIGFNVVLQFF